MEYLFFSFSPVDRDVVERLAGRLESAGYKAWLAEEVDGSGGLLTRQTVFAIERSDAFLLALSPDSAEFESFREQLRIAEAAGKPILAIFLDPASLPPELENGLNNWPAIQLGHDLEDGFETLLNWLEDGDWPAMGETIPAEWIGDEDIGEIQRLPEETDIWVEDGYYWYKNWKTLPSIKAHLTNKRLIFFWDSRDSWKWKQREWDQLGEAFPISVTLTDINGVGQIKKPKLLVFPTSKPFVEIETLGGEKHKITLNKNFELRVNNLQQLVE
jgi:hypothetical protein